MFSYGLTRPCNFVIKSRSGGLQIQLERSKDYEAKNFDSVGAGHLHCHARRRKAHNVITTGGVEIAVQEWADVEKTKPFEDLTGVMPNTTVTKIAEIKNTGASDAWVRVKVEKNIKLQGEGTPDTGLVELTLNTTNWTEKDGYFYYTKALKPGEVTTPIFTAVTFKPDMGNEYQNATATVDVSAQAVQTANNGATAMDAKGWPNS